MTFFGLVDLEMISTVVIAAIEYVLKSRISKVYITVLFG